MSVNQQSKDRAKKLRKNLTDAERLLWKCINRKQLCGAHFRRQVPMDRYIVDFVCHSRKLIIEVDGGQHSEPSNVEYDIERTDFLEDEGYKVIRFWNNEVLQNTEGVVEAIRLAVKEREHPVPHPKNPS